MRIGYHRHQTTPQSFLFFHGLLYSINNSFVGNDCSIRSGYITYDPCVFASNGSYSTKVRHQLAGRVSHKHRILMCYRPVQANFLSCINSAILCLGSVIVVAPFCGIIDRRDTATNSPNASKGSFAVVSAARPVTAASMLAKANMFRFQVPVVSKSFYQTIRFVQFATSRHVRADAQLKWLWGAQIAVRVWYCVFASSTTICHVMLCWPVRSLF